MELNNNKDGYKNKKEQQELEKRWFEEEKQNALNASKGLGLAILAMMAFWSIFALLLYFRGFLK